MVVTSRMLAAHTNGYPLDQRARFWSNYYRSLKGLPPTESYYDNRHLLRRCTPPCLGADAFSRGPWWHNIPELRPHTPPEGFRCALSKSDISLRPSFLSPVKTKYVWYNHPQRQRFSR